MDTFLTNSDLSSHIKLLIMPTEDRRKEPEMLESLTQCSPEIRKNIIIDYLTIGE